MGCNFNKVALRSRVS